MNTPDNPKHSPDIEDALKAMYEAPAPSDAFVHQLEQQLLARRAGEASITTRVKPSRRFSMFWQRSRQLFGSFAALAALLMLIVALIALFSNAKQLATNKLPPTPTGPLLQLHGSITQLSSMGPVNTNPISVSVRAPRPSLPNRVPLYDIKAEAVQLSVEAAQTWAAKLGLGSVRIYTEGNDATNTQYIAQADDGRIVQITPNGQIMYQVSLNAIYLPPQEHSAPDLEKARAAAEAFLNRVPDLYVLEGNSSAKITFRVQPSPYQADYTRNTLTSFEITLLIDGLPVITGNGLDYIVVGPDGQVSTATFTPLRITPTGKDATLQPVESVVGAFLNGDQHALEGTSSGTLPQGSAASEPQIYYREPSYPTGEIVMLSGYVRHWVAADGGADQYIMSTLGPQAFLLTGQALDPTAVNVEITGRITGQSRTGLWGIEVISSRSVTSEQGSFNDWLGTIHRQTDGVWLETSTGQKYLLPDPPAELSDGQQVMAPGVVITSGTTARLEWQMLSIMPAGNSFSGSTFSGSASSSVVVVPVTVERYGQSQVMTATGATPVESTQVMTAPQPRPTDVPIVVSSGTFQTASGGSVSSGEKITPTLPAWWTYKPGDELTLEGELSAQGYRIQASPSQSDQAATPTPERLVFEAYLFAAQAESKSDELVPLTLVGDQVNTALVYLDGLHVRVQGRLLSSDEAKQRYPGLNQQGFPGPILEVTHYEQALPNETKVVFSGQVRIQTLAGQEVAIFSDTLSNQEYVLADSLTFTYTLEMYRERAANQETLFAIGVVEPGQTFAGRSLLRLIETQSNAGGDPAQFIQSLRDKLTNPIQDAGPAPDQPTDITIDQIELAYTFQTVPPQSPAGTWVPPAHLIYRLTGHSADNRYTATYDLAAATTAESPSSNRQPEIQHPLNVTVGSFATLLGFDQAPDNITSGSTISVTLYWQVNAQTTSEHTVLLHVLNAKSVFLHVLDAKGEVVAQLDAPPANTTPGTTSRQLGEVIVGQYTLTLPNDLPAGQYQLVTGLYDPDSGSRLTTDQGNDTIPLTTIAVK